MTEEPIVDPAGIGGGEYYRYMQKLLKPLLDNSKELIVSDDAETHQVPTSPHLDQIAKQNPQKGETVKQNTTPSK